MSIVQPHFLPDAQPLVDRLGRDFFRTLPTHPGVYLLRDSRDAVLYVGKAKNLRKRLNNYRVANPERLPRRLLRLLHQAARIEWQACPDEAAALARERELLLTLRPRFNRAGVWPAAPKFLAWRVTETALELTIRAEKEDGWECHGPVGASAVFLRAALVRLLWFSLHPARTVTALPDGWFHGRLPECVRLGQEAGVEAHLLTQAPTQLRRLFAGDVEVFKGWVGAGVDRHQFEREALAADLETVTEFVQAAVRRQYVPA